MFDFVAGIGAVSKDDLKEGKARCQPVEQAAGTVAVLNACRVHVATQQQTNRIDQNMAFAPLHFLARIVADVALGAGSGLGRLAVDDGGTGLRLAAFQVPAVDVERIVNTPPGAVLQKPSEIAVNRALWWKVLALFAHRVDLI